ncbi:27967_t:CDS:2, partial [Racocetra persica]
DLTTKNIDDKSTRTLVYEKSGTNNLSKLLDIEEAKKTLPETNSKDLTEYSDQFDYSETCPARNKEHKEDDVKGQWGAGDYCGEETYRLYCCKRTFSGIP